MTLHQNCITLRFMQSGELAVLLGGENLKDLLWLDFKAGTYVKLKCTGMKPTISVKRNENQKVFGLDYGKNKGKS